MKTKAKSPLPHISKANPRDYFPLSASPQNSMLTPQVRKNLSPRTNHRQERQIYHKKQQSQNSHALSKNPAKARFHSFSSNNASQLKSDSSLSVVVRLRPLLPREEEQGAFEVVKVVDSNTLVLEDPVQAYQNLQQDFFQKQNPRLPNLGRLGANNKEKETLFYDSLEPYISDLLNGFNVTAFAYGATSAGKTFSIFGPPNSPGLLSLTVQQIYNTVEREYRGRDYKITFSFIEIFNENLRDLLLLNEQPPGVELLQNAPALEVRDDPLKGITVAGVREVTAFSAQQIISTVRSALKQRVKELSTESASSRSHSIFVMDVEFSNLDDGLESKLKHSKLMLCDLAGLEKREAGRQGEFGIHKSLMGLGNCISALSEQAQRPNAKVHVPYRDAKLTRLLKDTLGGNCKTVMIANISPSSLHWDLTHNTLKMATKAKKIRNQGIKQNVAQDEQHISKSNEIILRLQNELSYLRGEVKKHGVASSTPSHKSRKQTPPPQVRSTPPVDSSVLDRFKQDLRKHCEEEIVVKKRLDDLRKQKLSLNFLLRAAQNAPEELIKPSQNSNPLNNPTAAFQLSNSKLLREEIEKNEKRLREIVEKEQESEEKLEKLMGKREALREEWTAAGVKHLQRDYLELIEQYQHDLLQKLDKDYTNHELMLKHRSKDLYIKRLQEQIILRDHLLNEAEHTFEQSKLDKGGVFSQLLLNIQSPEQISGRAYTSFPLLKQQLKEDFKVPHSKFVPQRYKNSQLPPLRNKSVAPASFNIGVYQQHFKNYQPPPLSNKSMSVNPIKSPKDFARKSEKNLDVRASVMGEKAEQSSPLFRLRQDQAVRSSKSTTKDPPSRIPKAIYKSYNQSVPKVPKNRIKLKDETSVSYHSQANSHHSKDTSPARHASLGIEIQIPPSKIPRYGSKR